MKTREELIENRNLVEKQTILEKEFLSSLYDNIGEACFKYEKPCFFGGDKIQYLLVLIDNKIWVREEKIYVNGGYDKTLKVYFEIADFNEKELKESIGFSSLDEFRSTLSTEITLDAPKGCRFKLGDRVVHSYDDEFSILFKDNHAEEKSEKWQEKFNEKRTNSTYINGGEMVVIGFVGEKILLHHDDYEKFSLASDSDLISQQEINDIIFRSFKNVEEDNSKENKGYYDYKILGIDDNGQYLKYRGGVYLNEIRVKIFK
jgi:hypothetical protein